MKWYSKYLQVYEKPFNEIPQNIVDEIRESIAKLQSNDPIVTVSVIGYNEEKHLLACLWSLSEMKFGKMFKRKYIQTLYLTLFFLFLTSPYLYYYMATNRFYH